MQPDSSPPEQSQKIQSPCIRNCCLNENDICLGCFRTINEITGWADATDQQRRKILQQAKFRQLKHQERFT